MTAETFAATLPGTTLYRLRAVPDAHATPGTPTHLSLFIERGVVWTADGGLVIDLLDRNGPASADRIGAPDPVHWWATEAEAIRSALAGCVIGEER